MSLKGRIRDALAHVPLLDVWFRRAIWSRFHFPEAEMRLISQLTGRPLDVAIDIGAAMGGYAWLLNRKARRVIAFEPGRHHADVIELGCAGTRIELQRKAVGAEPGYLLLYTPGDDTDARHSATLSQANPVVADSAVHTQDVEVVTLDAFCAEYLTVGERVDFLKIDVEGFENEVIKGALGRISQDHPVVLCEIEVRHNPEYHRAFTMLEELGYHALYNQGGALVPVPKSGIEALQNEGDLSYRLSEDFVPGQSRYINNFLFVHKLAKLNLHD